MENKQIIFTSPGIAELQDNIISDNLGDSQVFVRTIYTVISTGTERANLMGESNISGKREDCNTDFPRKLGYCGIGVVEKIGARVKTITIGQRVIIYFGKHSKYNIIPEINAIPITPESVSDLDAALMVIAGFPAEGVRKSRLEYGESVMVVGLGILGLIAVQLARIAGAVPVIAVDPNPDRWDLARKMGADYILDPRTDDFYKSVQMFTEGNGVNVVVEASGEPVALRQALRCCAPFARVTLLGCTRTSNVYDLYHDIHYPGVSLIGAHNFARPKVDSYPGNWTAADDIHAMLRLIALGRLDLNPLISEIHSPNDAPAVYERLAKDQNFPIGVVFDWRNITE